MQAVQVFVCQHEVGVAGSHVYLDKLEIKKKPR